MSGLAVNVTDAISPALERLKAGLTDRTALHEAILVTELSLVKQHLQMVADKKRNPFGAPSSNFWGSAVENTTGDADADAATVSIRHPGIGRALHDVTILPGEGKKYLTIPLTAEAYNRRLAGMKNIFFIRAHGAAGEGSPLFAARHENAEAESGLVLLYMLVRRVFQKQDRTLLPTDQAFMDAAVIAADRYVDKTMEAREAA